MRIPVENLLQQYNQLATLAGILAGFAFSAVIQLLSVDKPGKLMTTVIIIFSVSATMFLFTLFSFAMSAAAKDAGHSLAGVFLSTDDW